MKKLLISVVALTVAALFIGAPAILAAEQTTAKAQAPAEKATVVKGKVMVIKDETTMAIKEVHIMPDSGVAVKVVLDERGTAMAKVAGKLVEAKGMMENGMFKVMGFTVLDKPNPPQGK